MKILITGGAGYIGYDLVRALDNATEVSKVTVFDNLYHSNVNFFTTGKTLSKTEFVKGDVLNIYDLEKVVKGQDVVIHLAAHVDFPYTYKDNFKYEQVNQYGTVVLYNLLEKHPPKKVIYLSSAAVYGFKEVESESTVAEPSNYYGISKLQGEEYMSLLKPKSEVVILRSANVFGYNPMVRLDAVINNFMFEALLYGKIKIHGTGNQTRPFIYLPNLVDKIKAFALNVDEKSGVYNLVEDNLSLNQLRDFLLDNIPDMEFTYVNSNSDIPGMKMSSNKITFTKGLQKSLAQALQDFRNVVSIKNQ